MPTATLKKKQLPALSISIIMFLDSHVTVITHIALTLPSFDMLVIVTIPFFLPMTTPPLTVAMDVFARPHPDSDAIGSLFAGFEKELDSDRLTIL